MATFSKKRNIRRRKKSSDSEDEEVPDQDIMTILEETKEAQKYRERQRGVSAAALLTGKKITKQEALTDSDPFKLKTGGMINFKDIKDRNRDRSDEAYDRDVANMGSTFAVETNQRDEDAEMMKYIEEEMKRKKGVTAEEEEEGEESKSTKHKNPEDKLYELPDHLKTDSIKSSEEMLSNQMLSGIPEVDLGIDAKIKNIELTEEAKQRHLEERRNKKRNTTSFVPANMAVNYVQHSRYMHEDYYASKHRQHRNQKKEEAPKPKPVVVGDADQPRKPEPVVFTSKRKVPNAEKATDDYHYERFKKQLRRY